MKKTLFLTAFMLLSSIAIQAATVVVTFGVNSLPQGVSSINGTFLGETGRVNLVSPGDYNYTAGGLVAFNGSSTGISLVTGAGACGSKGCFSTTNIKDSHDSTVNPDKFFNVFGSDMSTGNNGAALNIGSGSYTMQMQGLSAGAYTLTLLVGRANLHGTASSTYELSGVNIEGLSASLLDYSAGSSASLSGTTLSVDSGEGEWALVEYTFTVTTDDTTLNLKSNGTGNINALALSSVPEPATASLSLLGLAVLVMRRRRA